MEAFVEMLKEFGFHPKNIRNIDCVSSGVNRYTF